MYYSMYSDMYYSTYNDMELPTHSDMILIDQNARFRMVDIIVNAL